MVNFCIKTAKEMAEPFTEVVLILYIYTSINNSLLSRPYKAYGPKTLWLPLRYATSFWLHRVARPQKKRVIYIGLWGGGISLCGG